MKLALALCALPIAAAFVPAAPHRKTTQLSAISRRDALVAGSGVLFGAFAPKAAIATSNTFVEDDRNQVNFEPSQQARSDKIDVNGAFVVDYKALPGFFPHAAGKIASNGPYETVKDIYKIPGLTANDKAIFKKYENELTALPPGRMFKERINQRQST